MSPIPDLSAWSPRSLPDVKVFRGRFISIEPVDVPKHAEKIFEMFSAEDVDQRFRYLLDTPPRSVDDVYKNFKDPARLRHRYVIVDNNDGKVIGIVVFKDIVQENGTVELGLYFSHKISKKPGGTEAVYLALKHLFDDLGYRR